MTTNDNETTDAARLAYEIARLLSPSIRLHSRPRTLHNNESLNSVVFVFFFADVTEV
jgi:hypothetical protein